MLSNLAIRNGKKGNFTIIHKRKLNDNKSKVVRNISVSKLKDDDVKSSTVKYPLEKQGTFLKLTEITKGKISSTANSVKQTFV